MLLRAPPPVDSHHRRAKLFISQPHRIAAKGLVERLRAVEPDLKGQIALRLGHGIRGMYKRGLCVDYRCKPNADETDTLKIVNFNS